MRENSIPTVVGFIQNLSLWINDKTAWILANSTSLKTLSDTHPRTYLGLLVKQCVGQLRMPGGKRNLYVLEKFPLKPCAIKLYSFIFSSTSAKPSKMLHCKNINTTTMEPTFHTLYWVDYYISVIVRLLSAKGEIFMHQRNIYAFKSSNSNALLPPRDFSN